MRSDRWGGRIGYLLLLLAAAALYLFENGGATAAVLLVTAVLPLVSALLLYLPRVRPRAVLTMPDTLQREQPGAGTLTIRSAHRGLCPLYVTLTVENRLTGERQRLFTVCRLKKQADGFAGSCEIRLQSKHCGALHVFVENCEASDALGLFSRRFSLEAETEIPVLPKQRFVDVELGESADFLQDSLQYSTQKPGYDPSETFRIREYVPGDPIRQIHWKLSEKSDQLLVRDFGLPVVEQLLLLLEYRAVEGAVLTAEDMDQLLELLLACANALVEAELPFTLGWQGEAYTERQIASDSDLLEALPELLRTPIGKGQSVAGCYALSHAVCAHAHVAVFSSYPAPDLNLLQHGNRVTLVIPANRANGLGTWEQDAVVTPFDGQTARIEL